MKFFFSIYSIFFLSIFSVFSQLNNGKLFVLNEGNSAQKGTIGFIDYATNLYTHLDSMASYGNQIVAHNGLLYAIDGVGKVHIYDINANYASLAVLDAVFARGIAFSGNKMLLTSTEPPFLRVYEKTVPFSYLYGFDETAIRSAREEVIVAGNQAYLSGFYGDSVVYAINLDNNTSTTIGTENNPYQIEEINGQIYVACFTYNVDWTTNTQIHRINTSTNTIDANLYLPYSDGFTASNTHLYQKKSNGKVLTIDAALQVVDTTNAQGYFYGFQYDKWSNTLFYSETDYISTGFVGYIQNNMIYPTVSTSLSPRTFYFMANAGVAVENETISNTFSVYPNPAKEVISLQNLPLNENYTYQIWDMTGKKWLENTFNTKQIDISTLPQGMYFIKAAATNGQHFVCKWIKE